MSELLDAAIKAGDKIYFRGEKVESIEITRDKDEPPIKVDLAHTRASYLDTITEQPQLNENQQIVLEWLKNKYTGNADPFGVAACLFSQTPRSEVIVATLKLTRDEQAQVLKIFANWTLEQEEE